MAKSFYIHCSGTKRAIWAIDTAFEPPNIRAPDHAILMTSSTSQLPVWRWVAPPFKQWRNRFTSTAPEPNVRSERSIRSSNRLKFGHLIIPCWWRYRPPDLRCDDKFALHFNQWQNRSTSTPEPNMRSQRSIRRSNRLKFGHLNMPFWWRHRSPDFRFDAELLPLLNNGEIVLHPLLQNKRAIWAIDTAFEPPKIRAPDHAILMTSSTSRLPVWR